MFESFYRTRTISDIVFVYGSHTESVNACIGDYDYYHLTNDDVIYRTEHWDEILIETLKRKGGGISYGNDLVAKNQLCTFPVISADLVRLTGWLHLPTLKHLCADLVWWEIGRRLNKLYYHRDVIIEHDHQGKQETIVEDNNAFRRWRDEELKGLLDGR